MVRVADIQFVDFGNVVIHTPETLEKIIANIVLLYTNGRYLWYVISRMLWNQIVCVESMLVDFVGNFYTKNNKFSYMVMYQTSYPQN